MTKKEAIQKTKIQKILNQLISEEWIAAIMYRQFVLAAIDKENRHVIKDLLLETADDEMDDHYQKLVKFALHNGFSVPCTIGDYEKYASDNTVKLFQGWKKGKDAKYYIDRTIEAEVEAIASYEKFINDGDVPYELLQILIPNYYDEQEHLQKLNSLKIVFEAGMTYAY